MYVWKTDYKGSHLKYVIQSVVQKMSVNYNNKVRKGIFCVLKVHTYKSLVHYVCCSLYDVAKSESCGFGYIYPDAILCIKNWRGSLATIKHHHKKFLCSNKCTVSNSRTVSIFLPEVGECQINLLARNYKIQQQW